MAHLQTRIPTHARQVCSLYKRALRTVEDWQITPHHIRFEAVMLRARFDENKDVDIRLAKKLLSEGEKELFESLHPQPKKWATVPGGVAYQREPVMFDWILDTWDPIEKAQYPKYFAKREMWKKERIDRWEKKYGKIKDPWADMEPLNFK